jgi:hypothetical protein
MISNAEDSKDRQPSFKESLPAAVTFRGGTELCVLFNWPTAIVCHFSVRYFVVLDDSVIRWWGKDIASRYPIFISCGGVLVQPGGQMASCGNGADSLPLRTPRRFDGRALPIDHIVVLGILSPRGPLWLLKFLDAIQARSWLRSQLIQTLNYFLCIIIRYVH